MDRYRSASRRRTAALGLIHGIVNGMDPICIEFCSGHSSSSSYLVCADPYMDSPNWVVRKKQSHDTRTKSRADCALNTRP